MLAINICFIQTIDTHHNETDRRRRNNLEFTRKEVVVIFPGLSCFASVIVSHSQCDHVDDDDAQDRYINKVCFVIPAPGLSFYLSIYLSRIGLNSIRDAASEKDQVVTLTSFASSHLSLERVVVATRDQRSVSRERERLE